MGRGMWVWPVVGVLMVVLLVVLINTLTKQYSDDRCSYQVKG